MRRAFLALAILGLIATWLGPLPELAQRAFFAHMILHMSLICVVAPLLVLAIRGRRFDPVLRAPKLFAPIPASLLEFVVVWLWHMPMLHQAARHTLSGFVCEQGTFLISGLILWFSAFGGTSRDHDRSGPGVVALLLTSMHMTLLGALLALSPRPLYTHVERMEWLTPLEDQHLGGAIMLSVGGVTYLFAGLCLMAQILRGAALKPEQEK
jgi:putative membrane protein